MQLVEKISHTTGMPKKQVLQGMMALVVLFIVFGIGQSILTNLIGVAYPAFMSFHALESEGDDDDKQWLTYWVVFGCFTITDQFAGLILRMIPFYYVLKVAMLIWMFHPSSLGAITLYESFIKPFVQRYQGQIEAFEKDLAEKVNQTTTFVKQKTGMAAKDD